jgi:SNF family Na+-dependent transporter
VKEEWGSRLGVILAVSGSAVGLGNFLRFPGQAAENGGGAFLIPYFAALLLLGIPIGWAEWSMGRYGGSKGFHSAPAILGVVCRSRVARYLGVIGVLIPLTVSFYYVFLEAWTFAYFLKYLSGGFGLAQATDLDQQIQRSADFFAKISGSTDDGILFQGDSMLTVASWAFVFAMNIFFLRRGLSKGIERFCSIAMPAMAVCAFVVLIRVLTLGTPDPAHPDRSVLEGLGYMWNPNLNALGDPKTWLAAAGQIFFSLSVGFGIIINYASYLKPNNDVALSSLTANATNEVMEVGFGGMITLTASVAFLGISGTTAAIATGSMGLGFSTLPVVFAKMGPFELIIGALWFFMLFLAAITSSLSMYQPAVALLKEALMISHEKATTFIAAIAIVVSSMTLWYTKGGAFWNTLDFWTGTFLIFVLASIQIFVFSWVFGLDRGWQEIHRGSAITIPKFYRFIMKYVAPAYLLIVFAGFCSSNLSSELAKAWASQGSRLAILAILGTASAIAAVVWIGEKRWRAAGLDIDDSQRSAP